MNVFIQNIPSGIHKYELSKFIESIFNARQSGGGRLFVPIADVDIVQLQGNDRGSVLQYGLVRICPPELAEKVIKQIDGSVFKMAKLSVREFFDRTSKNDPRLKNSDAPAVIKEQRVKDRRTHNLVNSRAV